MGINNLGKLLDKTNKTALSDKTVRTVAVDASNFLMRIIHNTNSDTPNSIFIINLLNLVAKIAQQKCRPIFLLDGKSGKEKEHTIEKRQNIKHRAESEIIKLRSELNQTKSNFEKQEIQAKINQLCKKCRSLTKQHVKIFKNILSLLSIPYIHCKGEADSLCASLVKQGYADAVMSNDTDILTYGCPRTFQNFDFTDNTINDIVLDDLLKKLDISYYQFVDLCIILGNDYNAPMFTGSPQYALECIRKYITIENILANIKDIVKNKDCHVHIPKNFDYVSVRRTFMNIEDTDIKKNIQDTNFDKISFNQLFYPNNITKLKMFLHECGLTPQQVNDKTRFLRQVILVNNNRFRENASIHSMSKLQLFLQ